MIYVYVLVELDTARIRYVGVTKDWLGRQRDHKEHPPRGINGPVGMIVIDQAVDAKAAESKWIKDLTEAGFDLVNRNRGGVGVEMHTEEARAKMHGTLMDPAMRARMSATRKRRQVSPETRAKLSASRRRRKKWD